MASFAGLTSQPNLNAIVEAVRNTPLDTELDPEPLRHLSHYWAAVRDHYTAFECGMKAPDADLYLHEMPGGFPPEVMKRIVRQGEIVTGRPGESMPPADFKAAEKKVAEIVGRTASPKEVLSWLLYPRVFQD